jgi:hypothetical protein
MKFDPHQDIYSALPEGELSTQLQSAVIFVIRNVIGAEGRNKIKIKSARLVRNDFATETIEFVMVAIINGAEVNGEGLAQMHNGVLSPADVTYQFESPFTSWS